MPKYDVKDRRTGKTYTYHGARPPSSSEARKWITEQTDTFRGRAGTALQDIGDSVTAGIDAVSSGFGKGVKFLEDANPHFGAVSRRIKENRAGRTARAKAELEDTRPERPSGTLSENFSEIGSSWFGEDPNYDPKSGKSKYRIAPRFSEKADIDPATGKSKYKEHTTPTGGFSSKSLLPAATHDEYENWPTYLAKGAYNNILRPLASEEGFISGSITSRTVPGKSSPWPFNRPTFADRKIDPITTPPVDKTVAAPVKPPVKKTGVKTAPPISETELQGPLTEEGLFAGPAGPAAPAITLGKTDKTKKSALPKGVRAWNALTNDELEAFVNSGDPGAIKEATRRGVIGKKPPVSPLVAPLAPVKAPVKPPTKVAKPLEPMGSAGLAPIINKYSDAPDEVVRLAITDGVNDAIEEGYKRGLVSKDTPAPTTPPKGKGKRPSFMTRLKDETGAIGDVEGVKRAREGGPTDPSRRDFLKTIRQFLDPKKRLEVEEHLDDQLSTQGIDLEMMLDDYARSVDHTPESRYALAYLTRIGAEQGITPDSARQAIAKSWDWLEEYKAKSLAEADITESGIKASGDDIPSFAKTEGGGLKIGADVKSLGRELGTTLYKGNIAQISTKELLQNSVDAVRHLGEAGDIKVDFVRGEKPFLKVVDNGKGMTKEELQTHFTDLGASGKRNDPTAVGGKGIAKAAPLLGGEYSETVSVVQVGDQKIRYSFKGTPEELLEGVDIAEEVVPFDTPTGVSVKVHVPSGTTFWDAEDIADRVARHSTGVPGKIHVRKLSGDARLDAIGTPFEPKYRQTEKALGEGEVIKELSNPSAKTSLIVPFGTPRGEGRSFELILSNNGMYQAKKTHWLNETVPDLPDTVIADINSLVPEGHPDYPFTSNREELRGTVEEMVKKYIDDEIVKPAFQKRTKETVSLYRNMKTFKLDDGEISHIHDTGSRMTPQELHNFTAKSQVKRLAQHVNYVVADILGIVDDATWTAKLERTGLILDDNLKGIHIPNPAAKDAKSAILINPFVLMKRTPDEAAAGFIHTILHEVAHVAPGRAGHDEAFTIRLSEIYEKYGTKRAIANQQEFLENVTNPTTGNYTDEIQEILRRYTESRRRATVKDDLLTRTGIGSETKVGGARGVRGNVGPDGERILSPWEYLKEAFSGSKRAQQGFLGISRKPKTPPAPSQTGFEDWVNKVRSTDVQGVLAARPFLPLDRLGKNALADYMAGSRQGLLANLDSFMQKKAQEVASAGIPIQTAKKILNKIGTFDKTSDFVHYYERAINGAIYDREFKALAKAQGWIRPEGQAPLEWKAIDAQVFRPVRGQQMKASPQLAKVLNNYTKDPDETLKMFSEWAGLSKNLAMTSGILPGTGWNAHGANTLARTLIGDPSRVPKFAYLLTRPSKAAKQFDAALHTAPWAVQKGLTLTTEGYEMGKSGLQSMTSLPDMIRNNSVMKFQAKYFENPLFQKVLPAAKLDKFNRMVDELTRSGMGREEAGKMAAEHVNNLYGGINWEAMGRSKDLMNVMRMFLVAPDWLETNGRILKGMGKMVLDPTSPMGKVYAKMVASMIGTYVTANAINKHNSGHYMWENDSGHTLDVAWGKSGDTFRWYRPFGTAADFLRLPMDMATAATQAEDLSAGWRIAKNRMSVPARAIGNQLFNQDDFGREIGGKDMYGRKIPMAKQALGYLSENSQMITPPYVKSGIDYMSGKSNLEQAIVGTAEAPIRYSHVPRSRLGQRRRRNR